VGFHRALAHIQVISDYFVRLTLLDRADNGEFAADDAQDARGAAA
jgi:hypothetical protein